MTAVSPDPQLADAQAAIGCQCDRPMPMSSDDDIGTVCGRCGRTTDATGPATARAPRALVAVAKGSTGDRSQDWIVPGSFERPARGKNPTRAMRVLERLKQHGPATAPELAAALDDDPAHIRRTTNDLAADGLVVRAGTKPRETGHGRPATVWAPNTPSHAPTGSDEATQQAASEPHTADEQHAADADESPAGTAAVDNRTDEHEGTPSEDAAADGREAAAPDPDPEEPATGFAVDEDLELAWRQLQVQYVSALIGLITRSGILPAPDAHVFDRCERLLGLTTTPTTSSDEEARTA